MKTHHWIYALSLLLLVSEAGHAQSKTASEKTDSINKAFHDRMQETLRYITPEENGDKIFQAKMIDKKTKIITEVGPPIHYKPSGKNDGEYIPATYRDECLEEQYRKASKQ